MSEQLPTTHQAIKRFEALDTQTKADKIRQNMEYFNDERITETQRLYLAAFAEVGNKTYAARVAGVSPGTPKGWRKPSKNEEAKERAAAFVDLEGIANDMYKDKLVMEIDRRAVEGYDDPIFYQGEQVGRRKIYSDNLLMFRTKAIAPEYREVQEHRHKLSGSVDFVNRIAGLSDDDLRALAQAPIKEIKDEDGVIDV